MSIYFSGTFKRSGGVISAIAKQLKSVNLKAVKRITFTFDPFNENGKSTRELLVFLSSPKIIQTNPNCVLKTDVVCNREPSEVKFSLVPSAQEQLKVKHFRFISENLTALELLQLLNKNISVLAPEDDLTKTVTTKSDKKSLAGQLKSKKLSKKK